METIGAVQELKHITVSITIYEQVYELVYWSAHNEGAIILPNFLIILLSIWR